LNFRSYQRLTLEQLLRIMMIFNHKAVLKILWSKRIAIKLLAHWKMGILLNRIGLAQSLM